MDLDLLAIQRHTEQIARDAGDILLHYTRNHFNANTKNSPYDMVTDADREAEALIVEALRAAYPDHHIVGEEGGGMGAPVEEATYRWYIDPLDGTTNFVNGIPAFSVSMALADQELNPLVGIVYNPVTNEMFSAVRGRGTLLNDEPVRVSSAENLSECVLGSGFPYDKYTSHDNNLPEWGRFLKRTRGLRRMGSAALDLCFVACGRFDGYWESKLNPWDFLAGVLCVLEAGGTVTGYDGRQEFGNENRIVASNGLIHQQMLDVMAIKEDTLT